MQAVLVMFRSDGERRSFSVTRDVTVIGRREDCDLRIPLGDISRKHARVIRDGDAMRIEDLGSSNGTHLNGQRIEREADLQAGDSIQVGPVVFVLQVDGYPADEELNPITAESAAAAAMLAPAAVPTAPGVPAHSDAGYEELEPLEEYPPQGEDDATLNLGEGGGDHGLELIEQEQLEPLDDLQPLDDVPHGNPEDAGIDDLLIDIEPERK